MKLHRKAMTPVDHEYTIGTDECLCIIYTFPDVCHVISFFSLLLLGSIYCFLSFTASDLLLSSRLP